MLPPDQNRLLSLQFLFASLVPRLIDKIFASGLCCTLDEVWRSQAEANILAQEGLGIKPSVHCLKLAIDINLFSPDNDYLSDVGSHRPFGTFWKTLHPFCRWGGDFTTGDGNHYSVIYNGRS